jgi:hypothetical protein
MEKRIRVEKKQWHRPELIVLTRSKPEEAVLTGCKIELSIAFSNHYHTRCGSQESPCANKCKAVVTS